MGEQRQSGLSISVFCRERSIAASSFFAWRRKLGIKGRAPGDRPGQSKGPSQHLGDGGFAEVKLVRGFGLTASPPDAPLELRLRGDRRLIVRTGFDRDLLIKLVRTLEALA